MLQFQRNAARMLQTIGLNPSGRQLNRYSISSNSDSFPPQTSAPSFTSSSARGILSRRPRLTASSSPALRTTASAVDEKLFVSAHFQLPNSEIVSFLNRQHLTHSSNATHFIVRLCPFCHPQKDVTDQNKLYILKNQGVFHCHRCSAAGSWFEFKRRISDMNNGLISSTSSSTSIQAASPSASTFNNGGSFYSLRSPFNSTSASASLQAPSSPPASPSSSLEHDSSASASASPKKAASLTLDVEKMREMEENLKQWPEAMQYLTEKRGLGPDVIEKYGLGATKLKFLDASGQWVDQICITFPWIRPVPQLPLLSASSHTGGGSGGSKRGRKRVNRVDASATIGAATESSTAPAVTASESEASSVVQSTASSTTNPDTTSTAPSLAEPPPSTSPSPPESIASSPIPEPVSAPSAQSSPLATDLTSSSSSSSSTEPIAPVIISASPFHPSVSAHFVTDRIKARSIQAKNCQRLLPAGASWGWFGWHLVPADATTVVITEGEFDAMAVHQATGLPAISLPNGCSSLPPQLLPSLERFKKIVLWMDDDAPGQAGAESFSQKLGVGRCHIVRSRQGRADGPKDANDALRAGKDLFEIIQEASPMPHSQIATFDELRQDVYRELLEPGKMRGVPSQSLPTLARLLKGHRRGELTVLTGQTGTGKTTLLSQLSLDYCKQGVRTLWGSFEIKNPRLAKTMLTQFAQKNLEGNLEEYELWADQFSQLPMYFMRFYGSSEVEQVVDAMEYAVYVHDVDHVVLDNLQFMLSGQGRGIDKFDAQEYAIEVFRSFATRKNVHVTLVIHPRKEAEGSQLGVSSIFGTAKATQEADNVLIVQDAGDCRILEVKKNRFDGDLGSVYLRFDKPSRSFFELPEAEAKAMDEARLQQMQPPGRRFANNNPGARKSVDGRVKAK